MSKSMMNAMQILCGAELSTKLELLELTPAALSPHLKMHQSSFYHHLDDHHNDNDDDNNENDDDYNDNDESS